VEQSKLARFFFVCLFEMNGGYHPEFTESVDAEAITRERNS
jgi:hypothetical protein